MKFLVLFTFTVAGFLQVRPTAALNVEEIISGRYVIERDDTGLLKDLGVSSSGDDKFTIEYKKDGDVWRSKEGSGGKFLDNAFRFGEEFYETTMTGQKCKSTHTLTAPIIYQIVENKCDNEPPTTKSVGFDGRTMAVTVGVGTPSPRLIVLRKQ